MSHLDVRSDLEVKIEQRTTALFEAHQQSIYRRTDRIFAGLMLFQWLAGIVAACIISPRAWDGPSSHIHLHLWMALFLGGVITVFPVFLALTQSGTAFTRHTIAVGQSLMSALLIHLTGGRIETHFHVFGSLAFLAFYRDWKVLLSATVVVATDHLLRGIYVPQSVYGVHTVNGWRWVEHAGWVLFEDVFLILSCVQGLHEMRRIAERQAQLEASGEIIQESTTHLLESEERTRLIADAKEALRKANEVLENAVEGISQLDANGRYIAVNTAYAAMVGYTPEEMIGMSWEAIIYPHDRASIIDAFELMLGKGKAEAEAQGVRKDNSHFHVQVTLIAAYDDVGNVAGTHCFMKDISERKALEARISHQAFHDALSGLPNRLLFIDRVEQALARALRLKDAVAVMFLDLDNFKVINDSLGHEEGDRLLVTVAHLLQECVRPGDTVARLGGDEFTILLEDILSEEDAIQVAERIVERLREPIRLATREIFITSSIGIALSTHSSEETESLLRDADTAMYQAKMSGKAGYILFDRSMNDRVVERLELENGLRRALEQGEFRVLYQPILDMKTGEIVGSEALVRWEHPKLGLVSPAKFIPIAEETGLIVPIGAWVLCEACRQARVWLDMYGDRRPFVMSVNLSGRQLQSPDLLETVTNILQETGLSPSHLKLEITESVMMEDADASIEKLNALKALGILLAVDDFGTGYSSLSYLRRLPVDTVKIDRSFVNIIGHEAQPAAIVQTIIMLCRALNLDVTGEGIENLDQLVQLKALGCDLGQGYHFSKPVGSEAFNALLQARRTVLPPTETGQERAPAESLRHAA